MKRNKRILGLIIFIVVTLNACMYPNAYKWKVCSQANTKWMSEDESIVFNVSDQYFAIGTINVKGKIIDIYMTEGPARGEAMHIYPIHVLEHEIISEEDKYEYWVCSYKSEKEFVATVKKTTYYNVGQEIKFTRVDDTKQNSTP